MVKFLFCYARLVIFFPNYNHLAGIAVAYSAPARHGCLRVVENNYCASRRGMLFPFVSTLYIL